MDNLHKILGDSHWAYTGSMALMIHNLQKGYTPRKPKNVNIAVHPNARQYVTSQLMKLGYMPENVGKYRTHLRKNNKNINVIVAGSHLAPSLNRVTRYKNKPPVMNLKSLYNRKRAIRNNENFMFEKKNNRNKTNENIKRLKLHLGLL